MMTSSPRPAWTISEAAERCGVSRSTVRRYRESGRFPSAYKTTAGEWKIPLPDLLAVGWHPNGTAPEPAPGRLTELPAADPMAEQVSRLEQALAGERARADSAERLAASYRANVDDLRMALRMLGSQPAPAPEQGAEPVLSAPGEHPPSSAPEPPSEQPEPPTPALAPDTAKDGPQPVPRWRRLLRRR